MSEYYFNIVPKRNGGVGVHFGTPSSYLMSSRGYASRQAAMDCIQLVKENFPESPISKMDNGLEGYHVDILSPRSSPRKIFYFRLRSSNGRTLMRSEYVGEDLDRLNAILREVRDNVTDAPIRFL